MGEGISDEKMLKNDLGIDHEDTSYYSMFSDFIARTLDVFKLPFELSNIIENNGIQTIRTGGLNNAVSEFYGVSLDNVEGLKNVTLLTLVSGMGLFKNIVNINTTIFPYGGVIHGLKFDIIDEPDKKQFIGKVTIYEISKDVYSESYGKYEEGSGEVEKLMLESGEISHIKVIVSYDGIIDMGIYSRENRRKKGINKALIIMLPLIIERVYKENPTIIKTPLKAVMLDTSTGKRTGKQLTKILGFQKLPKESLSDPDEYMNIYLFDGKSTD